jgi:hypothetical protein
MGIFSQFNKKEIKSLVGASLILGFIISFTQWGYENFSLSLGIVNWFRAFILSFIIYLVYLIANKNAAKLHGAKITFKLWDMDRFWFNKGAKFSRVGLFGIKMKSFKAGIFIPILFSLFSNGLIKLATIAYTEITEVSAQRAGKKFKHLTDLEISRIHLAGPFACLLLAIILTPLETFNTLADLAKLVAIFSFVPFSKLDGSKILFGSLPLYIFGLAFTITSLLLINILPALALIFLGVITAIVILLIYSYRTH